MAHAPARRVTCLVPQALAAACDNLSEALFIIDDRRIVRFMNAAGRELIGVGAVPPPPTACSRLLGCGDLEAVGGLCGECWGARALRQGIATPYFETAIGPSGARVWVAGRCAPVTDSQGYAVLTLQPHPGPAQVLEPPRDRPNQSRSVPTALVQAARTLLVADYAALGRVDLNASAVTWLAQDGSRSEATARVSVPLGEGVRGRVVSTGRSLLITHFPEEAPDPPDKHPTMRSEGLRAALAVPVHMDGEPVGVLMVGSRRESAYGPADERVLSILADLAGALLADADGVLSAQAASIRAERQWLAAELHDGLAQSLSALTQKLKLVRWLLGQSDDSASLNTVLQEVLELSEHTHRDLRRALGDLNTAVTDGDFLPALQLYLNSFAQHAPLRVELVEVPGQRPPLTASVALQVLRVIQEALTNAHKHSDGSRVLVGWSVDRGGHRFTVADDGRGFTGRQAGQGFGLTIMAERARRIGGTLTVTSGPETGCTVVLAVPHAAGGGMRLEPDPGVAS